MSMAAILLPFLLSFLFTLADAQMPEFLSIDCGGRENYKDEIGLQWVPDSQINFGVKANISVPGETRKQYTTLRHFPADNRKYCYTLNVTSRTRYLVRATFLYGNFDSSNVYPKFDISLGPTHWWTVVISDAKRVQVRELILLATSPTISVCLSNATTGNPFISTLELRQFNDSLYLSDYETNFYLFVSARINFGALSDDPVRYPDDPFDRIWQSDSLKKANYLVDVASGTTNVSTSIPIDVTPGDRPPQSVMQTAVVGTSGKLSYRLNLDGFPGNGWAVCFFAEIENLDPSDIRKFKLHLPGHPEISKATVNIQENAQGRYRLYEPGFTNLSLPFILTFLFEETVDSTRGPLLNAMEINRHLQINFGSQDAALMDSLVSHYPQADWALEGGDPCLPVPWSWVLCNSDAQPKVVSIVLSGKNLTGDIPSELTKLTALKELWLDRNSLTGTIPDFSGCANLQSIHLENNRLTGVVPSSLGSLQNLSELYLQNNILSGAVPCGVSKKKLVLNFTGNIDLHCQKLPKKNLNILVGLVVGASILFLAGVAYYACQLRDYKGHSQKGGFTGPVPPQKLSSFNNSVTEGAHCYGLKELEDATERFKKQIGSGGFGIVYYGRLKEGNEIAVKILSTNSFQGKREFQNEVSLLSRIHHRNLVQFFGYCQEEANMLVYEFMHNGTLKEHLHGPLSREKEIKWIKRLEIAEDAAKGVEYLHTGCTPSIIHRDLKTSNILLDKHMRAKVSDFGLSKLAVEGSAHISSVVRGTVGYLDPEYYVTQQLTDKSDIYSFGVILLELISGREAISNEISCANFRNIVPWAKSHVESGDIHGIIDPSLGNSFDIQSVWKMAEKAMMCVQPRGSMRPSISEVLKEIQEAISIEKKSVLEDDNMNPLLRSSLASSVGGHSSHNFAELESYTSFNDLAMEPSAR